MTVARNGSARIMYATWSGAKFGNSAIATGFFEITPGAEAVFKNFLPSPIFRILDVTITGASSGNGSFTANDFGLAYFGAAGASFDYTRELIGQDIGNGFAFGIRGDFNIFGITPGSPTGAFAFQLATANGYGDKLTLTSIAPGVDETASWPMMTAGFGPVDAKQYRRPSRAVAANSCSPPELMQSI